jgi:hypothetical protein
MRWPSGGLLPSGADISPLSLPGGGGEDLRASRPG